MEKKGTGTTMKKIVALLLSICLVFLSVTCVFAEPGYIDISGLNSKKANDLMNIFSKQWPGMKFLKYELGGEWTIIGVRMANRAAAATSVNAFFSAKDVNGEPVDLNAMLGTDELDISELTPFGVEGYEESMGDVDVTVTCAVPVKEDEKIAVVLGLYQEDIQTAAEQEFDPEWTVFEGKGTADDSVEFLLPGSYISQIQKDGGAILSIIREAYTGE